MGLFGRGKSGGILNVIRCDEPEYLVWKWHPTGQTENTTTRENAIRYGSSLRVKDGEVAIFVYKRNDGSVQDYIVGPYDDTIKTANFPVLSSIVGLAFGGESPFQAEIYFINLAGNIQVKFGIPYFDIADPRYLDFVVPVSAGGTITFNITDYKSFIKLNRLINFTIADFKKQLSDMVKRKVKSVIANAPSEYGFPVVQIERKLDEINDILKEKLSADLQDFGVNLKRFDLSRIEPDKESEGWKELRKVTANQQARTVEAQTSVNIKNLQDIQAINAENIAATLRIQREETQRAQRLQTETSFIGTHALDVQGDVLKVGAQSLGQAGQMGGNSGMNVAGMMTGMAMGGAIGQQMAGMMNQMGKANPAAMAASGVETPPPPPSNQNTYMVSVNGLQSGPYTAAQLAQYAQQGQFSRQTYVWCQGMTNWATAESVPELARIFASAPGSMPPPPPMP